MWLKLTDDEIFQELKKRLAVAEQKHPNFAEGKYQALGYLGEEYGETARAITKNEDEMRLYDELFDLLIVTWRFLRGDHERREVMDTGTEEGAWQWTMARSMKRV